MPQRDARAQLRGVNAVDEVDAAGNDRGDAAAVSIRELDIADDGYGHGEHRRALQRSDLAQMFDEVPVVRTVGFGGAIRVRVDSAVVDQTGKLEVTEAVHNGPVTRDSSPEDVGETISTVDEVKLGAVEEAAAESPVDPVEPHPGAGNAVERALQERVFSGNSQALFAW